mgnify:CR=1 FL=1
MCFQGWSRTGGRAVVGARLESGKKGGKHTPCRGSPLGGKALRHAQSMLSRLDVMLAPDIDGGPRRSLRLAQYVTLQAALVLAATVADAGWGVRASSVGASSASVRTSNPATDRHRKTGHHSWRAIGSPQGRGGAGTARGGLILGADRGVETSSDADQRDGRCPGPRSPGPCSPSPSPNPSPDPSCGSTDAQRPRSRNGCFTRWSSTLATTPVRPPVADIAPQRVSDERCQTSLAHWIAVS